jgi:hypothetical protein
MVSGNRIRFSFANDVDEICNAKKLAIANLVRYPFLRVALANIL